MAQHIDKGALVAEIKRILSAFENSDVPVDRLRASLLRGLLSFINTLEVKEVDLQKDSLTWKDINLIDYLLFDIKEYYDNDKLDKEEYYKEVLKKFKAQL